MTNIDVPNWDGKAQPIVGKNGNKIVRVVHFRRRYKYPKNYFTNEKVRLLKSIETICF